MLDAVDSRRHSQAARFRGGSVDGHSAPRLMGNVDRLTHRPLGEVGKRPSALARPVADQLHPRGPTTSGSFDGLDQLVLFDFGGEAGVVAARVGDDLARHV